MSKKSILYLILALVWVYEITFFSLFLIDDGESSFLLDFPHKDKVGHFGFYFGFVFLWHIFFKSVGVIALKKIIVVAIIYGIFMEILQYIMPYGRMFDVKDMIANSIGAILAYFFIKNVLPFIGRALKRKN